MHLKTLFTTLSVLIIISITLGTISLRQMDNEAREFINTTILGLFADWNNRDFLTHTSNELRQNLTDEQLHKINLIFRRLGKLLNYHGAYGGVSITRWHIRVRYKAQASFQNGQFTATITLIKRQGNWAIGRFEYQYAFFPNRRHSGSIKHASLRSVPCSSMPV
jgi:hypothetical protein